MSNTPQESDELIDKFIVKRCGNMAAHLLDSDDNDGEELRKSIRTLIKREVVKGREMLLEELNLEEDFKKNTKRKIQKKC